MCGRMPGCWRTNGGTERPDRYASQTLCRATHTCVDIGLLANRLRGLCVVCRSDEDRGKLESASLTAVQDAQTAKAGLGSLREEAVQLRAENQRLAQLVRSLGHPSQRASLGVLS